MSKNISISCQKYFFKFELLLNINYFTDIIIKKSRGVDRMSDKIAKNKEFILITIGTLLLILSFCLLFYDRVELIKSNVFDEVELLKYRENSVNEEPENVSDEPKEELEVSEIEVQELEEDVEEEPKKEEKKETTKTITKEFIGYLEISKVNLKQGLVSKNSYYNNVNRNIQILKESDFPDKENGNVILAAHSGRGYLSFFKNLYQLSIGDTARIYYKNMIYNYEIVNIYNVPKVGTIMINRNYDKSCLTLITCTKNSKTEQTVYILELTSIQKEGDNNA